MDKSPRMHDRRVMLKIKLKSLGDEIRAIRKEEKRPENITLQPELWAHRMGLRGEAHATHVAYNIVRGRPAPSISEYFQPKVDAMVKKYGAKTAAAPAPGQVKSIKANRKRDAAKVHVRAPMLAQA